MVKGDLQTRVLSSPLLKLHKPSFCWQIVYVSITPQLHRTEQKNSFDKRELIQLLSVVTVAKLDSFVFSCGC